MNTVNKARLRSTIAAIIAALVAFGPDIAELITVTDSSPKWLKLVTRLLGVAIALATNGKAVAMLNKFLPADTTPEAQPPSKGPDMKSIASIIVIVAALGAASQARADISLDTIAPKLTKCWGTSTCLMPAASVNAAMLNLSTKKWEAGTVALGAGLALLFAADTPYASGLVAHLTGVLSQEPGKSSFAMPSIGVLALRYIEVSYSYRMADGEPNTGYLSVAGVVPWDMFTRATIPERAKAARMRAAGLLREGDF